MVLCDQALAQRRRAPSRPFVVKRVPVAQRRAAVIAAGPNKSVGPGATTKPHWIPVGRDKFWEHWFSQDANWKDSSAGTFHESSVMKPWWSVTFCVSCLMTHEVSLFFTGHLLLVNDFGGYPHLMYHHFAGVMCSRSKKILSNPRRKPANKSPFQKFHSPI